MNYQVRNRQHTQYLQNIDHGLCAGTIPYQISSLTTLQVIIIKNNRFSGSVGSFFSDQHVRSSHLTSIDLSGETCYAKLTTRLFNSLTSLSCNNQFIWCIENQFSGDIPDKMFHSPSIKLASVSENCFRVHFPSSICQAASLRELYWSGLRSSGRFTLVMCYVRILFSFTIVCFFVIWLCTRRCKFKHLTAYDGTHVQVPSCILHMPNLKVFEAACNGLTGNPFSSSLYVSLLPQVLLNLNWWTGTIPRFSGSSDKNNNSTQLQALYLAYNRLLGDIPNELLRSPSMRVLDLSHNRLSGGVQGNLEIPQQPNSSLQLQVTLTYGCYFYLF